MTPNPITTDVKTPAHQAASMLNAYKFNALPVLENGRFVGMITVADFLTDGGRRHISQGKHNHKLSSLSGSGRQLETAVSFLGS